MFARSGLDERLGRIWGASLGLVVTCSWVGACGESTARIRADSPTVSSTGDADERPAWWFPHDIETGTVHAFHLTVHTDKYENGKSSSFDEEADFGVEIRVRLDGRPGCLLRLVEPTEKQGDETPGLAQLWLRGFAHTNHEGLQVGPDRVAVLDALLLNGPWRAGDRYTLSGFAWFFRMILGFVHFEVESIDANEIQFKYEFWFGEKGPAARGRGQLHMASDQRGMSSIQATWRRTLDGRERRVRLSITRTKISRREDATPDSSGE